jgi:hypothetical protein
VPGLGLVEERPAWRARRGLGAGFPLDFFEGTTDLTEPKKIVAEGPEYLRLRFFGHPPRMPSE